MYPWAYTWNPLAGECPHHCNGCYVGGKIAPWMKRMGNVKYYGEPRLVESELKTPLVIPEGYVIFVQSCGDLFANAIPSAFIQRILDHIEKYPQTPTLLQSRNPRRFSEFDIPKNCILGTTLETTTDYADTKAPTPKQRWNAMITIVDYDTMISIEPIRDFDLFLMVSWLKILKPKFVSIGADSGYSHKIYPEPPPEKIQQLINIISKFTEVRLKDNLSRISNFQFATTEKKEGSKC